MIIRVRGDAAVLEEIDNLRALKVVAPVTLRGAPAFALAIAAAGRPDGEAVWVSEQWLRDQAGEQPTAWTVDFEKMLAFAEAKGWRDEAAKAVRAHMVWQD
ncbi:hypothetical protein [Terricaulis silvestris]|uniref:Uncharacterized protein n=1 Tax=Terricaulis silvestris TaxID=2686094 RepID=A0A6I6MGE3_9CAUL|nr:hypothetical protein [Terricaulis silvestris]QGZ93680.1 hypothetical protein DSM104635_00492 [Terricaulis silvestris]